MAEPYKPTAHYLHDADPTKLKIWWKSLDDNRGLRARLRRIDQPEDALLTDAFSHFLQFVPDSWSEPRNLYRSVLVATVLAQIESNDEKQRFASQLGINEGDRPTLSELRFKQLIKSRTPDEFFRRIARAIKILKKSANITSVAEGVLRWHDEFLYGYSPNPINRLSVKWAQDYYSTFK